MFSVPRSRCLPEKLRRPVAFTLVELLVAMTVLAVLLVLMSRMVQSSGALWRETEARNAVFQDARTAYETMTQKLGNATLNTYYDYDNPQKPTTYQRQSELHYVSGPANHPFFAGKLGSSPTQCVFFQAPLGAAQSTMNRAGPALMNAVGYYVSYDDNSAFLPGFLSNAVPRTFRYRLREWQPPTESFPLYPYTSGGPPNSAFDAISWLPLNGGTSGAAANTPSAQPSLADNVIALIVLPRLATADANGNPNLLTTDYFYDSRNTDPSKATLRHQLPPLIRTVLVAVDETSYRLRVRPTTGGSQPAEITGALAGLFLATDQLDNDLHTLTQRLDAQKLRSYLFDTTVEVRGAKWSE